MDKINCWQFKKCGREPEGSHNKDLGVCPASVYEKLNGIHGGKNGGRACWAVAGTLCNGEVQGMFAQKIITCMGCDFYMYVKKEEHKEFIPTSSLFKRMNMQ